MTDPAPSAHRPGRALRWALVASLAVNFVLVGLGVGAAVRLWRMPPGSAPGGELRMIWHALPEDARRALRGAIDDDGPRAANGTGEARRARVAAERAEIRALILAEPFDRAALEARLVAARDRQAARADRALARMLDRIEALAPAERARMAERMARRWERRSDRE